MNSADYMDLLRNLENRYTQIRVQIIPGNTSKDQALLHTEAAKICEQVEREMEGTDRRWTERKNFHIKEATRIMKELTAKPAPKSQPEPAEKEKVPSQVTADEETVSGWFKPVPKHSFADVQGMEDLKGRLSKLASRARKEGLFELLDMERFSGILFYGPPGTGKTFITEAFVHELMQENYKYINVDSADIVNKYVGETEKIIKEIFQTAQDSAPCILFIDEIDNLCMNRSAKDLPSYKMSQTEAFLTAYNNLKASDKDVFFIAATNYPHLIDPAMHSRMSLIKIPLPGKEELKAYLDGKLSKASLKLDGDVSLDEIAESFENCSYRDVNNLIRNIKLEVLDQVEQMDDEDAVRAVSSGDIRITRKMLEAARSKVIFTPVRMYLDELEAWEKSVGIDRS